MATDPPRRGLAVVISGPSGVGKTTICRRLLDEYGYEHSVSATTREPRPGERNGADYWFLSAEEFKAKLRRGELLEHSEHFGHMYGTPARPVREAIAEGRTILLEIDVNGAKQLMESLPEAYFIFITAPDAGEQARRLRGRHTESEASIRTRLQRTDMEIASEMRYNHRVVNRDLDQAAAEVHSLIQKAEAEKTHEGGKA